MAARLKAYALPSSRRSLGQLLVTASSFAALWLGMWVSLDLSYWVTLLLAVPAAGFLVRFFIIQHDCGHRSYFRSRWANDLVGRALGVLTLTPYDYWRKAHAVHHATSGNLDRRGIGDINTLTVGEYRALSGWRRLLYRLYRNPLVLFGVGPTYLFVLKHRFPLDLPLFQRRLWVSVLVTNVAIIALSVAMAMAVGVVDFVKVQLPVVLLASSIGVWLFFVQHQFDGTYWRREGTWNFHRSAFEGSSYYRLPRLLQWFTASIGLHHVHHLCSKVPNYRLKECLERIPELSQVRRITLLESLRCARLSLWDEERGAMVSFGDLKRRRHAATDRG
ncbi:MAG: fatty acid desaturase [Kiloniellales bacterium]|nr:fatty acid desaturase [Kiloniellales bacterium]